MQSYPEYLTERKPSTVITINIMNIIVAIIDYKTPWPCSSGVIF